MTFDRTASIEAISSGWSPKTANWYGRERVGRLGLDEAAIALCGIEPIPLACYLWSMGHHEPEHATMIVGYLHGCFDREPWPASRLKAMIAMCLGELSDGYAVNQDAKLKEGVRARNVGIHRSNWNRTWQGRYAMVMNAVLRQVGIAEARIGLRVWD